MAPSRSTYLWHLVTPVWKVRAVSSCAVLVGEDLATQHHPVTWHRRNFEHQPGGVFRSDEEWRLLFAFHGLVHHQTYNVRHRGEILCRLSMEEYNARVYRALYVLWSAPTSATAPPTTSIQPVPLVADAAESVTSQQAPYGGGQADVGAKCTVVVAE